MDHYICPVSGESFQEERINHWTHRVGFLLSIIGFPFLIYYSSLDGDKWFIASNFIYGTSLILLYLASTYYHGCDALDRKRTMQIVDHACIYLLIAGSCTPFALGPLRDSHGWTILYIEWGLATAGIFLKIVAFDRFQVISLVAYLVMGWLVVFIWPVLMETLSTSSISLLMAGGAFYTFGTIFYLWEKLPYNHAVWHLFVLSGSICHYFAILGMA